ncbi:CU044_5270 family protein [Streptosporangium roseum]|uniref:CU044_5270 family protein n=1 Tax=Streptosporangium roseum TaxID=2001 RepID=UPI00332F9307
MNDLETIKAHHDSLPGPAPKVAARAWNRLAAEAEVERTGRGHRSRRPRGRSVIRVGVVVGFAAAVTAGAIMVTVDDGFSPLGTRPANAAELLRQAAAADQDLRVRPDQFVYVSRKDRHWSLVWNRKAKAEYAQNVDRESWIPAADPDKALTRSTYGTRDLLSGRLKVDTQPAGTVEYQRVGQCPIDLLPARSRDLTALPTDPDQLLAKVRKDAEDVVRAEKPTPGEAPATEDEIDRQIERTVVTKLVLLAENPFPPPRLRATVFRALSTMPTATMIANLSDAAGRPGMGASIRYQGPDGWEREELIFEPKTYRFLGWRAWIERRQDDGGVKETLIRATAIMTVKVVDSMPEVPEGAGRPAYC